jgi:hypothetical protein
VVQVDMVVHSSHAWLSRIHSGVTVTLVCCADVVAQVRIIFLSQLLQEGRSHLQQHLTASVLGRKVFVMPFHRGIQVTQQALRAMKAALAYCQKLRLQPAHFTRAARPYEQRLTKKHVQHVVLGEDAY